MRIALVHDWLAVRGGAERVLLRLHALWPQAPIYTLGVTREFRDRWLPNAFLRQAWPGKIPGFPGILPALAPLLPAAVESLDLADYDVVVSSSVLFSKGVVTRSRTKHICYCYSPSRMLWDRHAVYERRGAFSALLRHGLRLWDFQAAQRPDTLVAISDAVRDRIHTYYRRDALVIHPPLLAETTPSEDIDSHGYYLTVGRLMPHKNPSLLLDAFARLNRPLVIVGDGPLESFVRRRKTNNVRLVGTVSDGELTSWYAHCRALILPNDEDFGMTAIEAMAHGKPVLALRAGGALDTIQEGKNGLFFADPIAPAVCEGILRMEQKPWDSDTIRRSVERFSGEQFDTQIRTLVETT